MIIEVVNLKDFKKEERRRKRNERISAFKKRCGAVGTYLVEHPLLLSAIVVVTGSVIKTAIKTNSEDEKRYETIYDRSAGHYWNLNRKLDQSEWLEVDRRKSEGEPLGEIFSSMNVLR